MAKIFKIGDDAMRKRIKQMVELRDQIIADGVEKHHVRLQRGNNKTGENCYTVSLIPIVDCPNCDGCAKNCYDLRNVCWQPNVQFDRARNSAIHEVDPDRYWKEIEDKINELMVTELRGNVGGDYNYDDFVHIGKITKANPRCDILFFTKSYDDINKYLDEYMRPKNMKPIMSAWPGMKMNNPHNLPVSHVLWEDGSTTAPDYGAYFCNGNCSRCHFNGEGCWILKDGENVVFKAH